MGGSVKNVLLVLGVNAVAAAVPFTPQGAGVAQALLVKVFAGTASGATVAAYSVGQQIAIGAFAFGVGFAALFFIFRVRSFKEIIARGREDRQAEKAGGAGVPQEVPREELELVGDRGLELRVHVDLEVADRVADELGVG